MNVYGVCEKAYRGVPLYAVCAEKERERAFEMKSVAIVPQEKHPFFSNLSYYDGFVNRL
jgi:hypothetical protein